MTDGKGYIYVLSNPSMPDVYKIGRSINGGITRAKSIYSATGVPERFSVEFEILVENAPEVELLVHEALEKYRVNKDREFFRCPLHEIIEVILQKYTSDLDLVVCYVDENEAIEASRQFAAKLNEHPFEICHAFRFLSEEAVKEALSQKKVWLESRKKRAAK